MDMLLPMLALTGRGGRGSKGRYQQSRATLAIAVPLQDTLDGGSHSGTGCCTKQSHCTVEEVITKKQDAIDCESVLCCTYDLFQQLQSEARTKNKRSDNMLPNLA